MLPAGDDDGVVGQEPAAAWVSRTFAELVAVLGLYCGDRSVAEDCAQEAMVRLWPRLADIDDPRGWVFRVGFNVAASAFRRRVAERRAVRTLSDAFNPAPAPDADRNIDLQRALQALSPRQRQAVVLHYLADLSVPQVATVMSCSQGAVKSHLARGLSALRDSGLLDSPDASAARKDSHD